MRVLIATATAGGGHLQAAAALDEAWRLKNPRDIVERLDILDFTPRLYRKAYAEGYVRLADKAPELYAHAFRISDNPAFVKKISKLRRLSARWITRKFIRELNEFEPDVVLCPHFLPLESLGSVEHRGLKIPPPLVVCVITDFEAHALWMEPSVDLYCVATAGTKARLVARGVNADHVIVTGIPVSQRFVKPIPRRRARQELDLKNNQPAILVLGGGLGMGPLVETMAQLDQSSGDFQMMVVAGKNEELRKKLSRCRYRHPTRVFGFVQNMQLLMAASDLIVTKPGGLTSSEALALGKPLLIVNPLPGQEAANSDFLLEGGAAVKANRLEDLRFRLDGLLKSRSLAAMTKAAKRLGRPNAAIAVCKAVRAALMLFVACIMTASWAQAECPVRAEEEVLLFPTIASQDAGGAWTADVHGWIFKPEKNATLRTAMLKDTMRLFDIPQVTPESDLFKQRIAYFLVDSEPDRPLTFEFSPNLNFKGKSDAAGHVHGSLLVKDGPVIAGFNPTPVPIAIQGCEQNPHAPPGELWLIPPQGISVISDIDDTVKFSNVLEHRELIANTFLRPYSAIEGMAPLYTEWAKAGAAFEYVSASPWPLYPELNNFLKAAGFPPGPLLLKHFHGKSRSLFSLFENPLKYKVPLIRELLKRYPHREFILVGDSGEKDPEVYGQIAREFGSQVRLILIRNLNPEFDAQARYRRAFRGMPDYQWQVFSNPQDVRDALIREPKGLKAEEKAVLQYREGLQKVMRFVDSKPEIFPPKRLKQPRLMSRYQKDELWTTWNGFLEYILALDSIQSSHIALPRPGIAADRESFLIRYGAFVAQYRWALELLVRLDNDSSFQKILNEPVPEVGLSRGTYNRLKYRFLNLGPAGRFAAMNAVYAAHPGQEAAALRAAIKEDEIAIRKTGRGQGEVLTVKNGAQILNTAGFTLWLPVQTGVSEWMGDTKVWRVHDSLIKPNQIAELRPKLLPGDILLERREWYLSNIGLPGYWPHAALYIGSLAERRAYFGDRAEKNLEAGFPKTYANSQVAFEGHPPALLEAMSEGVVFTSLEHSAAADSMVVLRPRVSKEEKIEAIRRAFHYAGRPYDFNFDFATDSTIVCSELVYKAYEPNSKFKGVTFNWGMMLGRPVSSPNMMAEQFDQEYGKPDAQMDLIEFLDGNERAGRAYSASVDEFRSSWKRPKWHIWVEKAPDLAPAGTTNSKL